MGKQVSSQGKNERTNGWQCDSASKEGYKLINYIALSLYEVCPLTKIACLHKQKWYVDIWQSMRKAIVFHFNCL